jgi:predicted RNA-binding protein with PIN domain
MNNSLCQSLLLVDGYNVIGAWPSLKKVCDRHGLEPAREKLIEALIDYTHHQGYQTRIVFDAYCQDTPGNHERYTSHLSVYFTAHAQTADTYIEKTCADFWRDRGASFSRIIVATSDNAQKLTVMGYGAECVSAQRLEVEVDLTGRRIKDHQRPRQTARGRFLFHSLDSKVQQKLERMRHGTNCRQP